MKISKVNTGKYNIEANETEMLLIKLCIEGHLINFEQSGRDRRQPAYTDALRMQRGIQMITKKHPTEDDAQN